MSRSKERKQSFLASSGTFTGKKEDHPTVWVGRRCRSSYDVGHQMMFVIRQCASSVAVRHQTISVIGRRGSSDYVGHQKIRVSMRIESSDIKVDCYNFVHI